MTSTSSRHGTQGLFDIERDFQRRERQTRPSARNVIERRVRAEQARERANYLKYRRLVELRRLFQARHGHSLPDSEAGWLAVMVVAHHIGDPDRIRKWIDLWAPWVTDKKRGDLIREVVRAPQKWKAEALGQLLGLRDAERQRLRLRTIRACDVSTAEGKRRRLERQRQCQQRLRRARGVVSRAEYEAKSISRTKPWLLFGFKSRRTWERHGKPVPTNAVSEVCQQYPASLDLHGTDLRHDGSSASALDSLPNHAERDMLSTDRDRRKEKENAHV